jgi:hypothetical protein
MVKLISVEGKPYWMVDLTPTATIMLDLDPADLAALHNDIGELIEKMKEEKQV